MDKTEYKSRIEEMQELAEGGMVQEAMEIADGINWRKVHNINDLLTGSSAYEYCEHLEEAKDLLLLAHERSPIGRMIIFRLCRLSIRLGDMEEAQEYYNEFVSIAPHDSLKFILKYNIAIAKRADDYTLIKILEQLREQDFLEEWSYELANLYHKVGNSEKCVNLCDEIILWFGDGPYVERAIELKMLYQPLSKDQEEKYRHIQQEKQGITEVEAYESLNSGELVAHTVTIQPVSVSAERFNTVNLQAEIKKSIEEIMNATETEEVSENLEAIKSIAEDIPYLNVPQEETEEAEKTVDELISVNERFEKLLKEEYDGQLSLVVPEESNSTGGQVEGQMTIEEIMAEWEKTRRAAQTTLEEARKIELESAKSKALKKAQYVLDRLEGVIPQLNAGITPAEILKESYSIPKVDESGEVTGRVSIPVVHLDESKPSSVAKAETGVARGVLTQDTIPWTPPELEAIQKADVKKDITIDTSMANAAAALEDINKILQSEIDTIQSEKDSLIDHVVSVEDVEEEDEQDEVSSLELFTPVITDEEIDKIEKSDITEIEIEEESEPSEEEAVSEEVEEEKKLETSEEEISDTVDISEEAQVVIEAEEELKEEDELEEKAVTEEKNEQPKTLPSPSEEIETIDVAAEVEEKAQQKDEIKAVSIKLDAEDEEFFAFFMPVEGMKEKIEKALSDTATYYGNSLGNGHIIVSGDRGAGKTQMATKLYKVLQKKTGLPQGAVGKIDSEKLNQRDLHEIYNKIAGGALIIENASDMTRETALTLNLLLDQDEKKTLLILEDTKIGIDRALTLHADFAARFTSRIDLPAFSIDDLVEFARDYAIGQECIIDEMAILALYNRINMLTTYEHATSVKEVVEIMDEAILSAKKGIFAKRNRDGLYIIKEKHFDL